MGIQRWISAGLIGAIGTAIVAVLAHASLTRKVTGLTQDSWPRSIASGIALHESSS